MDESSTSGSEIVGKEFEQAETVYALHLWPCSPILAQYVFFNRDKFAQRTVLELGCGGTAVPGIAAWKCGAKVIFADKSNHERALDLCRKNCRDNGISDPDVRGLDWGWFQPALLELPKIDFILASDCFFDPSVFDDFLWTLAWLFDRNPQTQCFVAYQDRNSEWTIDWLLDKWKMNCKLIDLNDFHGQCVKVPGFQDEMNRHIIHICEIS